MKKYTFSHGKIFVEEDVYPPINRDDQKESNFVLILVKVQKSENQKELKNDDETDARS